MINPEIAYTVATKNDRRAGDSTFVMDNRGGQTVTEYLEDCRQANLLEEVDGVIRVRQATKKGYIEASDGDVINLEQP